MKNKHIYICENTTSGIFTAIYEAWASNYGHANNEIVVKEPENLEFFTEHIVMKTDLEKANKVARSIQKKISREAYIMVYNSTLSKNERKADIIYRFLIIGFAMGKSVLQHMSNDAVMGIVKMDQNVKNEFFHYEGFLRFTQINQQLLLARFRPENDIITVLAEHFADRLSGENWMIYDERRKIAAIHEKNTQWFLYHGMELEDNQGIVEQDMYFKLFKRFVDSIAIKERENEKLQLNMLPNRFREFMPEVEYKSKTR